MVAELVLDKDPYARHQWRLGGGAGAGVGVVEGLQHPGGRDLDGRRLAGLHSDLGHGA